MNLNKGASLFDSLPPEVKTEAYQMLAMAYDNLEDALKDMSKFQGLAYLSATLDCCINVMTEVAPKEVLLQYLGSKLKQLEKP